MSQNAAEQSSDTSDTGLAPAPLENQGGDDFASLLESPGGQDTTKSSSGDAGGEVDPTKPAPVIKKAAPAGDGAAAVVSQSGTTPNAGTAIQGLGTQAAGLDPKLIEEIVAASTRGVAKATAEQKSATAQKVSDAQQMTAEQFNDKYGIRPVTPADIGAILDQDPAKAAAAMNTLLIAAVRSAVLMSKDVVESQIKAERGNYEGDIKAFRAYQAQQREEKAQSSFYAKYPDLVNEKELVQEMIDALKAKVDAGQVKFTSDSQVFDAVAASSRKLLARMNTQATGSAAGNAAHSNQRQAPSRQMATASSSGRSGTGQAAAKSDVDEVFGADAR